MNPQNEISDEEFIPFLNDLGVDTYKKSFEWMLNDPDFSGVLRWIYNSLDENNALSAREEYRYAELEKNGKVLSEQELENSLASLQQEYPGICMAGDKAYIEDVKFDLNSQSERLAMLEKHEDLLKDILKQNELTNEELNVEITQLNAALQQSAKEETCAQEECVTLAEEVESMTNQLTNEVAQILSMYEKCKTDKEIAKRFFVFGPFEAYRQTHGLFKGQFDMFSSRMIYKTQREHVSHDNLRKAFLKAQEIEERFTETVEAFIETKANLIGEQTKLIHIRNFTNLHPSQVTVAILEAKSNLDLLERENSLIEDEVLVSAVRDYVERRTTLALDVTTRTSLAVREELFKDMRFLTERAREALALDRVLYGALRCELGATERLLHFADQLREYLRREAADVRMRTKSMTDICADQDMSEQNALKSNTVLSTLAHTLGGTDSDPVTAVKMHDDVCGQITELLCSIDEGIRSKEDRLVEFKKQSSSVLRCLYEGGSHRGDGRGQGATLAHALRHHMDAVDAAVLTTTSLFNTVKNGDHQNVRKLWQWFLTEPARLLAAVRPR